jgi:hypothetical protein
MKIRSQGTGQNSLAGCYCFTKLYRLVFKPCNAQARLG